MIIKIKKSILNTLRKSTNNARRNYLMGKNKHNVVVKIYPIRSDRGCEFAPGFSVNIITKVYLKLLKDGYSSVGILRYARKFSRYPETISFLRVKKSLGERVTAKFV